MNTHSEKVEIFEEKLQALNSEMIDHIEDLLHSVLPESSTSRPCKVMIFDKSERMNSMGSDSRGIYLTSMDYSQKDYLSKMSTDSILKLLKKIEYALTEPKPGESEQPGESTNKDSEESGDKQVDSKEDTLPQS